MGPQPYLKDEQEKNLLNELQFDKNSILIKTITLPKKSQDEHLMFREI